MSELTLRGGPAGKGALSAIAAAVAYVAIPLPALSLASSLLSGGAAEQLGLRDIADRVLLVGIPPVILSFLKGFYAPGSYPRALFGGGGPRR